MRSMLLPLALAATAVLTQGSTQNITFLSASPSRFTSIPMLTPLSGPCDVSSGPDNNIYVQQLLADKIFRFDPLTNTSTEFPIPFTQPLLPNLTLTLDLPSIAKAEFLTCAIRNGYDGLMYFSNGNRNQLVQFNTSSEEIRVLTPPGGLLQVLGNLQPLNDITTAPDGVYTSMTTANAIAKFEYETEEWTFWEVPTPASVPLGMYYASDGGVWFLEFLGQKIGRLDRHTGEIIEYDLPLEAAGPVVVRAETQDSNGDYLLWFASALGGGVGSINERTKEILFYPENPLSFAVEVAQDYDDNIWISHAGQNTLGVLNPRLGNITEIIMPGTILPTSISVPLFGGSGIYSKPIGNPFTKGVGNAVWFTQLFLNRLVRFDLDGLVF